MDILNHKYLSESGEIVGTCQLVYKKIRGTDGMHSLQPVVCNHYLIEPKSPYFKSLLRLHFGSNWFDELMSNDGFEVYSITVECKLDGTMGDYTLQTNLF